MSTGTICLTCRRYIYASDLKWRCKCPVPVPSEDGKNPICLTQPEFGLLAGGAAVAVGAGAMKDRDQNK